MIGHVVRSRGQAGAGWWAEFTKYIASDQYTGDGLPKDVLIGAGLHVEDGEPVKSESE